MKFGYARISIHEQNHDLQLDALRAEGCERIFTDNCSARPPARTARSSNSCATGCASAT